MWLVTGSLLKVWWRMSVSGAKISPCLLALSVVQCLPLCLSMQPASSPLIFTQSFVLRAGQAFRRKVLFFFFSLAIPQFGLLSHVSSFRLSSGQWSFTLRAWSFSLSTNDAAHSSLSSPCSLVADVSIWTTFLLAVAVRHIFCVLFCFFLLLVMLPSEIPNSPQTRLWEGFLLFGNFSFMFPFPGWVSIPNSFVSLFVFYILSYFLLKRMSCLSGCLVSSISTQKLFCGSCSAFKWSLDEFVGEKVVFQSYSSTNLGPLPDSTSQNRWKTVFQWFPTQDWFKFNNNECLKKCT